MQPDAFLIDRARRFTTGANADTVKNWILCYENALPSSPRFLRYDALLRDFVLWRSLDVIANEQSRHFTYASVKPAMESDFADRLIEAVLRPKSA